MRVNFFFDEELYRRMKAAAAMAGTSIKQWIADACREKLKKEGK